MWPAIPFEWVADFLDHMDALNFAKSSGVEAEVAKALLDWHVYVYAKDSDGRTPLHWACVHGHVEVAKALERGADIHADDSDGRTPQYYALLRGRRKEGLIAMLWGKGVTV